MNEQMVEARKAREVHYLYTNMRDVGCNCGKRYHGASRAEAERLHAEHLAAVAADPRRHDPIGDQHE